MSGAAQYVIPLAGVAVSMTLFAVIVARFQKHSTGVLTIKVTHTGQGYRFTYTNLGALSHSSDELTVLSTASAVELYQTDATNQGHPLYFNDDMTVEYKRHGRPIGRDAYTEAIRDSTLGLSIRILPPPVGPVVRNPSFIPRSVATTEELLHAVYNQ